jgi:hypothetical protein
MKKLFLAAFLMTSAFAIKAQGNLQFNQVITACYGSSGIVSGVIPAWTGTVPANKVWKIETLNGSVGCKINSNYLFSGPDSSTGAIWLKSGDTVGWDMQSSTSSKYLISIIEFNIVP